MVGHMPLEHGTLVRIQASQPKNQVPGVRGDQKSKFENGQQHLEFRLLRLAPERREIGKRSCVRQGGLRGQPWVNGTNAH